MLSLGIPISSPLRIEKKAAAPFVPSTEASRKLTDSFPPAWCWCSRPPANAKTNLQWKESSCSPLLHPKLQQTVHPPLLGIRALLHSLHTLPRQLTQNTTDTDPRTQYWPVSSSRAPVRHHGGFLPETNERHPASLEAPQTRLWHSQAGLNCDPPSTDFNSHNSPTAFPREPRRRTAESSIASLIITQPAAQ